MLETHGQFLQLKTEEAAKAQVLGHRPIWLRQPVSLYKGSWRKGRKKKRIGGRAWKREEAWQNDEEVEGGYNPGPDP